MRAVPARSRVGRAPVGGRADSRVHLPWRHLSGQHLPAGAGRFARRPARRVLPGGGGAAAALRRLPGPARRARWRRLSPELFLRRAGRAVTSSRSRAPPGGRRPGQADRQRAELERSAKNRAENVMIVDMVRNDLSRVCAPGTVTVPALLARRAASGRLAPGLGGRGHAPPRLRDGRPDPRGVPAWLGDRRAQGPCAGDHRRARARAPRGLYRRGRLPYPGRGPGAQRRDPHVRVRGGPGAGSARAAASWPTPTRTRSTPSACIKAAPLLARHRRRAWTASRRPQPVVRGGLPSVPRDRAAAAPRGRRLHLAAGHRRPARGLDDHLARLAFSARHLYGKPLPASSAPNWRTAWPGARPAACGSRSARSAARSGRRRGRPGRPALPPRRYGCARQ